MEKVLKIIEANIRQKPTIQGFADQYHFCLEVLKTDIKLSVRYLKRLNDLCEWAMVNTPWSDVEVRELFELHKKIVLAAAPHDFECYLLYVEWDREPEKKFYLPRRSVLKEVVDAMQDLLDDKLDLLTISMPPGTGKSTLGIFFLSMVMGKYPDNPNLASAHSGLLTRSFFDGALQIITDPEYLWADVFPGVELAGTNTKEETIDLGKKHRFSTLTCRAINASLTGATRCEKILYADDLVSGIEEAMSKDRLDKLWISYTNDLKSRKKLGAKEIHIATRWSVHDVIGRLEQQYGDDPRARFIVIPALNENGESNFDYDFGVGFDTAYFEDMMVNLDDASFKALYMNQPIEREGLVYNQDELRRYFELPDRDPDGIIAVCDTKDKGSGFMDWNGHLVLKWYEPTDTVLTMKERHDSDLKENAVTLTGVQVVDTDGEVYLVGDDGYAINIESNSLIQNNYREVAEALYDVLNGFTYTPFTATVKPMPQLYPLDMITFVDKKGVEHPTIITDFTFTLNKSTVLQGKGETATKSGYASSNPLTKRESAIINSIKHGQNTAMNDRIQTILAFNELISNALGLYVTPMVQLDGSTIYYMHNLPKLEESSTIFTMTANGIAWTTSGWNDGEPVWSYGVTSAGDALFRMLSAEGIEVSKVGEDYNIEVTPRAFKIYYRDMLVTNIEADEMTIPKAVFTSYAQCGKIRFAPYNRDGVLLGTNLIFID